MILIYFSITYNILKMDNEQYISMYIFGLGIIIFIIFVSYLLYLYFLKSREISNINSMYPSLNSYIKPITSSDPDCNNKLFDYYIKTAFNSCSGGSYKNDFVSGDILKALIKQGIRCFDFEIYSLNGIPIVSTSTNDDYFIKETFNYVEFSEVMQILKNYAFASGTCPNSTDPLFIHLRIKSNHAPMYNKLTEIFKNYSDIMLGMKYSYETEGINLGTVSILELKNKIGLIIDKSNDAFMSYPDLLEFVNMTSNSMFMRKYFYYDVKNNPDMSELINYNKNGMSIVLPDKGSSPENPSGIICRANGCQLVAMRYQYADNFLIENTEFFDRCGYAFCLKPEELRYKPATVEPPTEQNPEYSYETKNVKTDYYNFNF